MSYWVGNAPGASWAKRVLGLVLVLVALPCHAATRFQLTWEENATNETYLSVERQPCCGGGYTALPSLPADTSSWTDSAVTPGIVYCYRVRACNLAACSPYSNVGCAVLPQGGQ
jgi:hypothetical protein